MSVVANVHQQAVLDFVRGGTGHGVVEATAGSGKTTTLVQVAALLESELLAPGQRACFLAFNRSTATELRARLPAAIEATTIHALGRRMLVDAVAALAPAAPTTSVQGQGPGRPGDHKYRELALALLAESGAPLSSLDPHESAEYLARLADLSRLELIEPTEEAEVQGVTRRYRLRSPAASETPLLHGLLPALLARGVTAGRNGVFDFTDMLYVPLQLGLAPPSFAFVCVDEAQDLSRLNLEFVMRLIAAGARALFVGDPHQAIYAFAGADARSLERITARTNATRLPLSVSFRCPRRHVAMARRFSPDMQAAVGAEAGTVTILAEADLARRLRPGDLVMTRTNAPLIALSLALAERGTASRVLGDDLATETIDLASRLFPTGRIAEGHAVVTTAAADEARELELRLLTDEALPRELDRSAERHQALLLALDALERYWRPPGRSSGAGTGSVSWWERWAPSPVQPTVDDLGTILTDLLVGPAIGSSSGTPAEPVILSTIHKAKGREADRVFLYRPESLGQSSGNDDDDLSERNVLFVALTRAKHELVLVESERGAVAARLGSAGRMPTATHVSSLPPGERRRPADGAAPTTGSTTAVLHRGWNDVLRLASVMARSPTIDSTAPRRAFGRLIIRHAATRRVQEPGGQAGGGRRRGGRR